MAICVWGMLRAAGLIAPEQPLFARNPSLASIRSGGVKQCR